jgi:hypothetical protein
MNNGTAVFGRLFYYSQLIVIFLSLLLILKAIDMHIILCNFPLCVLLQNFGISWNMHVFTNWYVSFKVWNIYNFLQDEERTDFMIVMHHFLNLLWVSNLHIHMFLFLPFLYFLSFVNSSYILMFIDTVRC